MAGPRRAESSASRACSSMSIASSQSLGASPKLVAAPGAAAELVEPCVFFARAEAFPAPISFAAPSVASQGPLEGAKRQAANFQLKTRKFFIGGARKMIASALQPLASAGAPRFGLCKRRGQHVQTQKHTLSADK